MRIAFSSIITGESLDVAVLAKTAEGLGYDSFWVGEHPIFPVVNTAEETSPPGGPAWPSLFNPQHSTDPSQLTPHV